LVVKIEALEIDDHILEKIESKHHVDFHEIEEACYSDYRHIRKSADGLYKLFSQTIAGRYLLVVLVSLGNGVWKIVTAREMIDNERRLYGNQLEVNEMMNDLSNAVEKLEQNNAWVDTDEVVQAEVKKPLDKVIPVRLSSEKWEELRREAKELGIGPTTLARMWILERLRQKVKV